MTRKEQMAREWLAKDWGDPCILDSDFHEENLRNAWLAGFEARGKMDEEFLQDFSPSDSPFSYAFCLAAGALQKFGDEEVEDA